ncbi:helix-turn-helix domain-containing protein [Agromyces sp. SYSU K20354]|uniref:GbsR/MarR family transcriptional regulator n=1 Tax=Agromyces cavernae TaxID=2898659 RepID=UPI001E2B0055|nr:helix-turn-helix domain-containing protein [Agromyces cavernae]MCD2442133.1 helix-turn-helix domain-containing protein [Agromyces cavernae]
MVGGRLTLGERRSIEAGMAEGLGYAEIGRRLGRPTSTISREVARNGHRRYSADQAHDSAAHRVRNRTTSPHADESADETRDFIEEFAGMLAATGMPRMASRVFTSLLISDAGSLTAADLVRGLRVSPAAVSRAIGYLEGMDLLSRQADHGRRERYFIGDDVWLTALHTDSTAHARVADAATRGIAMFGPESRPGIRLAAMGRFFGGLTEQIRGTDLADPAVGDTKSVLAALVHARRSPTADQLAAALGWSTNRTLAALETIEGRPVLADPFVVRGVGERYTVQPRPDRLSADQRAALSGMDRLPD